MVDELNSGMMAFQSGRNEGLTMFYRFLVGLVAMLVVSAPASAQEMTEGQGPTVERPLGADAPDNTSSKAAVPISVPAPAQIVPDAVSREEDLFGALSLEDLLNVKVTVASKEAETVGAAPSVVTVFTRDDIRRLGVRTVQQLLNYVPGFQANLDEADHFLAIDVRGRSTSTAEAVLVMIDGQRVNDLFFGAPGFCHGLPTENIEQVEIIRGPGSALYGANAFLAVINIKTNRSRSDVTLGSGNMNRRYAAINAAKSYGDLKLASFVKLYADEGDSYPNTMDPAGNTVTAHDPTQAVDGSVSAEYRGAYLRARYSERQFGGVNCCSPYSLVNKYGVTQATGQLGYRAALTDRLDLDAYGAYQRDDYSGLWPSRIQPSGGTAITGFGWNAWSMSPNVDLQWRLLTTHSLKATLMAGGTYARNRLDHFSAFGSQDPATGNGLGGVYPVASTRFGDPYRVRIRQIAAGYVQGKLDLASQLTVTVGSRYDWYSDFGKSINPRAAVVWATPWKSHVKLTYGHAFRAPQIFEVGLSRPAGLKPETVQTVEAGYVQQILDVAEVTADVFYQKLDNLIDYDADGFTVNVGHFATKGVEVEFKTNEVHGARLIGSYTHLIRAADDPGITPQDFGSVAANYVWQRIMVNLSSTFHGTSQQRASDVYAGGAPVIYEKKTYALVNARLQVEIVKSARAFAMVENLFDYRYQPTGLGPTYYSRGRTFLLGLSSDF